MPGGAGDSVEITKTLAAMRLLEGAYEAVFQSARPGMAADEIDQILARHIESGGGTFKPGRSTPYVVDPAGVPPKLRLNRVPLETGKLWAMDNTIGLDGFYADLGRYAWFGPVPPQIRADHQRILDRQDEIARAIRPGRPIGEIYKALEGGLAYEVHRIGPAEHLLPFCGDLTASVMRQMHESIDAGLTFTPGMILCIELWAGMMGGIEDMYLVEENGAQRVSTLDRPIRQL